MRITAALLIALFAIIGTTSAIDIGITSPKDGDSFNLTESLKIPIRSHVIDDNGNSDFRVRTYIDGDLNKNSNWHPPGAGIYEIECRIIMLDENYAPTGEIIYSDPVTITVK